MHLLNKREKPFLRSADPKNVMYSHSAPGSLKDASYGSICNQMRQYHAIKVMERALDFVRMIEVNRHDRVYCTRLTLCHGENPLVLLSGLPKGVICYFSVPIHPQFQQPLHIVMRRRL